MKKTSKIRWRHFFTRSIWIFLHRNRGGNINFSDHHIESVPLGVKKNDIKFFFDFSQNHPSTVVIFESGILTYFTVKLAFPSQNHQFPDWCRFLRSFWSTKTLLMIFSTSKHVLKWVFDWINVSKNFRFFWDSHFFHPKSMKI